MTARFLFDAAVRLDNRPVLAVMLLSLALPAVAIGCEDQSDPKVYLGPVTAETYTAPPVYTPGTPTATPTTVPTTDLVDPPPAKVAPCPSTDLGGAVPSLSLASNAPAALAVEAGTSTITLFAGSVGTTLSAGPSCPAGGGELPNAPVEIADIGALVTLDGRGLDLVAGTTGISARLVTETAETRVVCALPGAKSVAAVPGTTRGFAITGSATLHVLDWSDGACVVTPLALAGIVGTTAVATAADGAPWLATIVFEDGNNGTRNAVARVRRFDLDTGNFDEFAPVLGGQPGTVCGAEAIALSESGDRLAILDGVCGRLVAFATNTGELVSGASLRAKAIAPIPASEGFLTVASVSGSALFHSVD
jgi:hypothetical protein